MNKKILISLSVIGAVAAIATGGTIAYFSDTETSTGNTFTAGSIDLTIDNECYLNGELVDECTWELTDLTDELFFDFEDLKPGDWGEDTVSVHVDNNDAWACVTFDNLVNNDNSCTEPEDAVDEPQTPQYCGTDPNAGELAQNLYFVFWADDGNNVYEPSDDEYILMEGSASDVLGGRTYTIADSEGSIYPDELLRDGALIGSDNYYIGKVWCFGNLDFDEDEEEWICDGVNIDNASQSDEVTGTIEFYAVQARNNGDFVCGQPR